MQLFTRTPTLTAMTAAGLDYVSGGRFTLGIGASGPQVVEGFHGVRYDAPLARTREIVEICRMVWRRDKLSYKGEHYRIPLPPGEGTGLGKSLKLINYPVREHIPVTIAAIGPKNVALAAELAQGWEPIFFWPEKAQEVWGASLESGFAQRDPELGKLDISVGLPAMITSTVAETTRCMKAAREQLALYIGGMGAPGRNFYNDLARRYGYGAEAATIQHLYLAGRKDEAAHAIPEDLVLATSLIGPVSVVQDRLDALRKAGVTTIKVHLLTPRHDERLATVRTLANLIG